MATSWRGFAQEFDALELPDVMAWPEHECPASVRDRRVVVRRRNVRQAVSSVTRSGRDGPLEPARTNPASSDPALSVFENKAAADPIRSGIED